MSCPSDDVEMKGNNTKSTNGGGRHRQIDRNAKRHGNQSLSRT